MPLELRRMRPSDLPARERIFRDAFAAGLRPHIYPNGTTDVDSIHNYTEILEAMAHKTSHSDNEAGQRCFVVYDTDAPAPSSDLYFPDAWDKKAEVELKGQEREDARRIVGLAIWQLQPFARRREEVEKEAAEAASHAPSPSANAALLEAFGKALTAAREKWIGLQAYLYLKVLAIDPAYQRRGVGSLLLNHGLAIADRTGLQAFLEATAVGRPLYKRYGFEDREFMDFDVAKYAPAAEGQVHEFMCMVRPAPPGGREMGDKEKGGRGHSGNEAVVEKAE